MRRVRVPQPVRTERRRQSSPTRRFLHHVVDAARAVRDCARPSSLCQPGKMRVRQPVLGCRCRFRLVVMVFEHTFGDTANHLARIADQVQ
jgi:hypothetical protein